MNKHLKSRTSPWIAAALITGAVAILFLGAYGLTRAASRGEVMGRVEVAGTPIGGLDRESALIALVAVEEAYAARTAWFIVDGGVVSLSPREVGFDLDEESIVRNAMAVGRSGSLTSQFWWWLTHVLSTVVVPVAGSVDPKATAEVFDSWDTEVISLPPNPGRLILTFGVIEPSYPTAGTGVDRDAAMAIIGASLLAAEAKQSEIPTVVIEPDMTRADVDAAKAEAEQLISGPIRLIHDETEAVFSVAQIVNAFRSETVVDETGARIVNYFDHETVDRFLAPIRSEFEDEPVDAEYTISGDSITIIPGLKGTRIDESETADRLASAGLSNERLGLLPIVQAADPETTTEYLESLNINHLVSQWTTYHACCAGRVDNIQLMADTIDGAIVFPGETFSLNEYVGERTREKGYVPAGTIVAGELKDTIGGGVSQFATTFYNAVFWGGYEDVEHQPHSYYFSRYPEGIEATVNWRAPELIFRNNRDHAILIDTEYTGKSITVRFFGDNDGRVLKGEQSGGRTDVHIDVEGGPNALHVVGLVSDRYRFTGPPYPRYKVNPDLALGEEIQTQKERGGWSVTVTREILRGGTVLIESQEWTVRYAPTFAVFEVGDPCMIPDPETSCPSTTTLTTTPSTTTTATTIP